MLGALLSFIIAWSGLVYALPAQTAISNQQQATNNTQENVNNIISNNNTNSNSKSNSNSRNQYSSNSSIQSDHSRNSRLVVLKSEYSLDQNQSISAEFNMRTLNITNPLTAINSITAAPSSSSTAATPSSSSTTAATIADVDPLGFVFSSAPRAHLAILSRTERSIRHQHLHMHHQQLHNRQQQQSPVAAASAADAAVAGNSNFIGSKSKRLNNSRNNLHINSSSNNNPNSNINNNNPSNLDRNERSTISHMAGVSRKIQLYIKNRILQLLPDGTVNGTQNEQSEYSEYPFSYY